MNRTFWMFVSLVLLTATIYWPVGHYGLVNYDDRNYLFDNPFIKLGLTVPGLRNAFTHFEFYNYAPLVSISYYIDQDLLHLNPGPMHIENVLLHLITGLLLWRLLLICTGKIYRSFAVAALFLCHPMHVESVAWISERKDVLSTPLLVGAMLAYVGFCKRPGGWQMWLAYTLMVFLFALSLLAKSMGVTLPAVLLLMDVWPLRRWPGRNWSQLIVEKLPLIALSILFSIVSAMAQGDAVSSLVQLDLSTRLQNALICYVVYIAKLIVPINLAVFYPHPMSRPLAASIAGGGLLLLITVVFYRLRHRRPYLLVGWLWFLGTLVPVIGLIQLGAQAMADRYSYFPSIGLFIIAVWSVSDSAHRNVSITLGMAVLAIFAFLARMQVSYWYDSKTLFTHAAQVTDGNYLAHHELGAMAYQEHDLKNAAEEFELALVSGPDPAAYDGLGNCWIGVDRSKSIWYYRQAISLNPRSADYHLDLAVALRLNNNLTEARQQAQTALTLNPNLEFARQELAKINAQSAAIH